MKKAVLIGFLIVALVAVWVAADEEGEDAAAEPSPPGSDDKGEKGGKGGKGGKRGGKGKKGRGGCMKECKEKVDSDPAIADQECSKNCGKGKDKAGCPAACSDAMKACKTECKSKKGKGDKSKKDKPTEEE